MWFILIFWWGTYAGQVKEISGFETKTACEAAVKDIYANRPHSGSFKAFCVKK